MLPQIRLKNNTEAKYELAVRTTANSNIVKLKYIQRFLESPKQP